MFDNVDTYTHTHTYPRTTEAYLYYKLTYEPEGSGELKIQTPEKIVVITCILKLEQFGFTRLFRQKVADGMANIVDTAQTAPLIWVYNICPGMKTFPPNDQNRANIFSVESIHFTQTQ